MSDLILDRYGPEGWSLCLRQPSCNGICLRMSNFLGLVTCNALAINYECRRLDMDLIDLAEFIHNESFKKEQELHALRVSRSSRRNVHQRL